MKFLIDAHLPSKFCEILKHLGIVSIHVDQLPHGNESTDSEISTYADYNDLIVVTKDIDFYHSHISCCKPKKLFLITTGNLKNKQLFDLFRNNILLIKDAIRRSNFVEINNEGLIVRT